MTMANTPELPAMTGKGVGRPCIPAIESLVEEYHRILGERIALSRKATHAKGKILLVMNEHNIRRYNYYLNDVDNIVTMTDDNNIKILSVKMFKQFENSQPYRRKVSHE
jgi:hypothetical protein